MLLIGNSVSKKNKFIFEKETTPQFTFIRYWDKK